MENAADEHREKPADSRRVYGTCRRRDPGIAPDRGGRHAGLHAAVVAAVAVFCPAAVFEGRHADHACRARHADPLRRGAGAAQEPDGRGVHAPDRLPVHHSGACRRSARAAGSDDGGDAVARGDFLFAGGRDERRDGAGDRRRRAARGADRRVELGALDVDDFRVYGGSAHARAAVREYG